MVSNSLYYTQLLTFQLNILIFATESRLHEQEIVLFLGCFNCKVIYNKNQEKFSSSKKIII